MTAATNEAENEVEKSDSKLLATNDNNNKDDDDEEEDDDYKPEEDAEKGDDDDDGMQVDDDVDDSGRPRLDYHKRKAVDESFTRLFGYDWGTEFELDEESMESPDIRELVKIFGPTRAARILGSPAPEGFYARKKPECPF